jgi:iron complex transport system substrate-binding protein
MTVPSNAGRQIGAAAVLRKAGRIFGALLALLFFPASAGAVPKRIVSTFLCTDEYVFRLVPRERIAALSFEAGDRNPVVSTIADKVGGIAQIRPSTESVLALKPDLVVMYAGTMTKLRANLKALGVPVLDVPWDNSLADIRRTATRLGKTFGVPEKAEAMLRAMDAMLGRARRMAARPSVRTLIYEPNGYAQAGAITLAMMEAAGLKNAAEGLPLTRTGTIPVEAVVAAAPELLILSGQRFAPTARADLLLHHPALEALRGRTTAVWDPLVPLLCPGPWSAEAAVTFAGLGQKARLLGKRQARN